MSEYMIGCDNVEKLPVINIVINNQVFPLRGEDYVFREDVVDAKRNMCSVGIAGNDNGPVFVYF